MEVPKLPGRKKLRSLRIFPFASVERQFDFSYPFRRTCSVFPLKTKKTSSHYSKPRSKLSLALVMMSSPSHHVLNSSPLPPPPLCQLSRLSFTFLGGPDLKIAKTKSSSNTITESVCCRKMQHFFLNLFLLQFSNFRSLLNA